MPTPAAPHPLPAAAINPAALEQAASWLMLLNDSNVSEQQRADCRRWQEACADNARAWARAESLLNRLGGLPAALAMPVLERPKQINRRHAVTRLASLLAVVPAAWLGWRMVDSHGWNADHATALGQRRDIRLADGSQIVLNSDTAIDVLYGDERRVVRLRHGEILVQTAPDIAARHRPFYVETTEGSLEALGTRFAVRQEHGRTQLSVFESAVRIAPRALSAADYLIVHAGHKASFTASTIVTEGDTSAADDAWTRGMMVADKMRLDRFAAELSRYRSGLIHCDAAVAGVLVSGVFPLDDTERVLTMLVSTYPVRAVQRFSGYWVSLIAPA